MATPASGPVLAEHLEGIIQGISITIDSKVADAVSQLTDHYTTTLAAFSAEVQERIVTTTTTTVDEKISALRGAMTTERTRIEERLTDLDSQFDDVGRTAAANTRCLVHELEQQIEAHWPANGYTRLVKEITNEFANVRGKVIAIEDKMKLTKTSTSRDRIRIPDADKI